MLSVPSAMSSLPATVTTSVGATIFVSAALELPGSEDDSFASYVGALPSSQPIPVDEYRVSLGQDAAEAATTFPRACGLQACR